MHQVEWPNFEQHKFSLFEPSLKTIYEEPFKFNIKPIEFEFNWPSKFKERLDSFKSKELEEKRSN